MLSWTQPVDTANYVRRIAVPGVEPPPTLWVEWRFRSNHRFGPIMWGCDAWLSVDYRNIADSADLHGDAVISESGDDWLVGLELDEFHTYRFQSTDGRRCWFSADGHVYSMINSLLTGNDYHGLQFGGMGGCLGDDAENLVNEWDYIRYGTIGTGERITSSDPHCGYLDESAYGHMDRFAVTFDAPNYVCINDITVETSGGAPPVVVKTRRRDTDDVDTLEIVLDRPLPSGQVTRFIFDDGAVHQSISYSFIPADTNADARIDLADAAAIQNCYGDGFIASADSESPTGACLALDLVEDSAIDAKDLAAFTTLLAGPGVPTIK